MLVVGTLVFIFLIQFPHVVIFFGCFLSPEHVQQHQLLSLNLFFHSKFFTVATHRTVQEPSVVAICGFHDVHDRFTTLRNRLDSLSAITSQTKFDYLEALTTNGFRRLIDHRFREIMIDSRMLFSDCERLKLSFNHRAPDVSKRIFSPFKNQLVAICNDIMAQLELLSCSFWLLKINLMSKQRDKEKLLTD